MPFDIGFGEILLILIVALVVFGPRRLPEIGASLGRAMRDFRRAMTDMTVDLTREPPKAQTPVEEQTCPKCGTSNPMTFNFCRQCGAPLKEG